MSARLALGELRIRLGALGAALGSAAQGLARGVPPPSSLGEELVATARDFAELRERLLGTARFAGLVLEEVPGDFAGLETLTGRIEAQSSRELARRRLILERATSLEAEEAPLRSALAALRQRAAGLGQLLESAFAGDPLGAYPPELERPLSDLAALLRLVENSAGLADGGSWDDDYQAVRQAFGRELAAAAARGLLRGAAPWRSEPAAATQATLQLAAVVDGEGQGKTLEMAAVGDGGPAAPPAAADLGTQVTAELGAVDEAAADAVAIPEPAAFAVGLEPVGERHRHSGPIDDDEATAELCLRR